MSWSGTVQPAPSRVARSAGIVTLTGASPAVYFSGWRICSVDWGIVREVGVDRGPVARALHAGHVAEAGRIGELQGLAQDRRRSRQHGLGGRVAARRQQLQEVGLAQVRRCPLGHRQGRVALVDRLPGKELVALVEDPVEVLEDRRVLVLERVVVLMREVEPLGRAGLAPLLDTT